jgi:hypothetical protein
LIKIPLHLSSSGQADPDAYLQAQADNYWSSLNPTDAGAYTDAALISLVKTYREKCHSLDAEYLKDYASNDQNVAALQKIFFDHIYEPSGAPLKSIITSDPNELDRIKDEIKRTVPDDIFYTTSGAKKTQTTFGKLLSENIFSYNKFRQSKVCLDYLTAIRFGDVFCPYCGYEPVELVGVTPGATDPEKALLDLDHFLSKAEFPYFAISLFNLIPCCHICNSRYKLTKEFSTATHVHPYSESFDDHFVFTIEPTPTGKRVAINSVGANPKRRSVSDFGLNSRYETKKVLLDIEREYRSFERYVREGTVEMFVDYMLKHVPRTQSEIITECFGKAKRDILKEVDVHDVLRPHIV